MITNSKELLEAVVQRPLWSNYQKDQIDLIKQLVDSPESKEIENVLEFISAGKFDLVRHSLLDVKKSNLLLAAMMLQIKYARSTDSFVGGNDIKKDAFGNKNNTLDMLAFFTKTDIEDLLIVVRKYNEDHSQIQNLEYTVKDGEKRSFSKLLYLIEKALDFFYVYGTGDMKIAEEKLNALSFADDFGPRSLDIKGNFYPKYYATLHNEPISAVFSKLRKLINVKDIVTEDIPIRIVLGDNTKDLTLINEIDGVAYNRVGDYSQESYRGMDGAKVGERGGKNTIDVTYNNIDDLMVKVTKLEGVLV